MPNRSKESGIFPGVDVPTSALLMKAWGHLERILEARDDFWPFMYALRKDGTYAFFPRANAATRMQSVRDIGEVARLALLTDQARAVVVVESIQLSDGNRIVSCNLEAPGHASLYILAAAKRNRAQRIATTIVFSHRHGQ